jgi:hypothetical protein
MDSDEACANAAFQLQLLEGILLQVRRPGRWSKRQGGFDRWSNRL